MGFIIPVLIFVFVIFVGATIFLSRDFAVKPPSKPEYNIKKARMNERLGREAEIAERYRQAEREALKPISEKEIKVNTDQADQAYIDWMRNG